MIRRFLPLLISFLVLILVSPVPSFAQDGAFPEKAFVSNFRGHRQSASLSCEARSATDLAAFWGIQTSEKKILRLLPRSDNPNLGFVGTPTDFWGNLPPRSYGVHARPIADALRQIGLQAEAHEGFSVDQLKMEISSGRPVIVWVIGQMMPGAPQKYVAKDGQAIRVARFEHTMVLIGYEPNVVRVVDAYSGQTQVYSIREFKNSWNVLGRMAVTVNGALPKILEPGSAPYKTYLALVFHIPFSNNQAADENGSGKFIVR